MMSPQTQYIYYIYYNNYGKGFLTLPYAYSYDKPVVYDPNNPTSYSFTEITQPPSWVKVTSYDINTLNITVSANNSFAICVILPEICERNKDSRININFTGSNRSTPWKIYNCKVKQEHCPCNPVLPLLESSLTCQIYEITEGDYTYYPNDTGCQKTGCYFYADAGCVPLHN